MNLRLHLGRPSWTAGLAAAALLFAAPAMASTITFSSLAPSAYASGDTLSEAGYDLALVGGPMAQYYGYVDNTGLVADAADPFNCDLITCPGGADGHYLMVLNDGAVKLTRSDLQGGFLLDGLDLAFVTPLPVADGNYGMLRLSGTLRDGGTASTMASFPGQDANGVFAFGNAFIDPAFRQYAFTSLTIDACLFDADMNCSNDFDHPAMNQAQFAIDTLSLTAVPEPGALLLASLGLGALALQRRRPTATVKGA